MRKLGKRGVKTTVVCPFFIKTGMFEGAASKWPLILPLLEPERAASTIVSAIRRDRPILLMPLIVNLVPLLRGILPLEIATQAGEWFGLMDVMDDFKGRAHTRAASKTE